MKKYNSSNYNIYKRDVRQSQPEGKFWDEYTRDELISKFLPLVENLARKFSTAKNAIGVLDLSDLIQEGNIAIIKAVDIIVWKTIEESNNPEKTLKSFLSKRIKGAIRRAIDQKRGTMRIPEHKINEIRKSPNDEESHKLFFNSVFSSLDEIIENKPWFDVEQEEKQLNNETISKYLLYIIDKYLKPNEQSVIKYSYGLDCDKLSAKQIAEKLNMKGSSSYVRVSQLKKQAIDKLKANANHLQLADYL